MTSMPSASEFVARQVDRPLRILISVAVVAPLAFIAFLVWSSARELDRYIDERSERTLDILQEHSLKVLQTTERLLYESSEAIGPSPHALTAEEEHTLRRKFAEIQRSVPEVQAIWAFDKAGHPLVDEAQSAIDSDLTILFKPYGLAQLQRAISAKLAAFAET
jgi:two-component system NtrC family sensor kinase